MTDSNENFEQYFAALQLTAEQKEAAGSLLNIVQRIEQLESTIRAMSAPQRTAVMRYWIEPSRHHGLNVELYRRTFSDLSQLLKSCALNG